MSERTIVRVAAAILHRGDGKVLLAQRLPGTPYAGFWEFPGGKLEPGESARDALLRELDEELGIVVTRAAPWLTQRYDYPHAHVELDFFRVFEWQGEPHGRDGQAIAWQHADRDRRGAAVAGQRDGAARARAAGRVCDLDGRGPGRGAIPRAGPRSRSTPGSS